MTGRSILLTVLSFGLVACETEVKPPRVGVAAPAIGLVANDGSKVQLEDYRGQWVVLYFCPQDFSTGCTMQARNFQQDIEKYRARNAVILGVSMDDRATHARFSRSQGLEFKLLADTDGMVSTSYGSIRGAGNSRFSRRNIFVIDPTGMISRYFLNVNPSTHSDAVLSELSRSQGMDPGRQRLTPDKFIGG